MLHYCHKYPYSYFSLLPLYFPYSHFFYSDLSTQLKVHPFSSCYYLLPTTIKTSLDCSPPQSLCTFLVSLVTPGYILTYYNLEAGTTEERQHAKFVLPGLIQYSLFQVLISFFFIAEWYSIVFLCPIFIIYLSIVGQFCCVYFLTLVYRVAVNMSL